MLYRSSDPAMEEEKSGSYFTLIMVRHGQGRHNLGVLTTEELEFTEDEHLRTINEPLTGLGLKQAGGI